MCLYYRATKAWSTVETTLSRQPGSVCLASYRWFVAFLKSTVYLKFFMVSCLFYYSFQLQNLHICNIFTLYIQQSLGNCNFKSREVRWLEAQDAVISVRRREDWGLRPIWWREASTAYALSVSWIKICWNWLLLQVWN